MPPLFRILEPQMLRFRAQLMQIAPYASAELALCVCASSSFPHCQAKALQNDQVFRPPPMLRNESTLASQEAAPQSNQPKRTPF